MVLNKKFFKNGIFASFTSNDTFYVFLEHIINILVSLLAIKYSLPILGLEAYGLYGLLLSLLSFSSIGSSGFAGSAVILASKYSNDIDKLNRKVWGIHFLVVVVSGIILTLILLTLYFFGFVIFSKAELIIVRSVLSFMSLSFFFASIGKVFLTTLDGLNMIPTRCLIGIFGKLVFCSVIFILVPRYGIQGLILAELLQYSLIYLISFILVLFITKPNFSQVVIPRFSYMKDLFNYGKSLQLTSILQILIDPIVRSYMKFFAGIELLGVYEILNKLLFNIRQFLYVFINSKIPKITREIHSFSERDKSKTIYTFHSSFIKFSSFILSLGLIFTPLVSKFLSLELNIDLYISSYFISMTMYASLFGLPTFVFNFAAENFKANVHFTSVLVILTIVCGFLFGLGNASYGVLIGFFLAQLISNGLLVKNSMNSHGIKIDYEFIRVNIYFFCVNVLFVLDMLYFNNFFAAAFLNIFVLLFFSKLYLIRQKTFDSI